MNINWADLQREITFKASRSGGKGGQNVNKVSTKVELLFNADASAIFTDEQRHLIKTKLASRFNKDGQIQVICDEERSQYLNKEKALQKLQTLLTQALHVPKNRKPTKISRAVKASRADNKKLHSQKKASRKKTYDD